MSAAYLHLTNGERVVVSACDVEGVINAIAKRAPVIVLSRYVEGGWWTLTIPLTGIAYIEQARSQTS